VWVSPPRSRSPARQPRRSRPRPPSFPFPAHQAHDTHARQRPAPTRRSRSRPPHTHSHRPHATVSRTHAAHASPHRRPHRCVNRCGAHHHQHMPHSYSLWPLTGSLALAPPHITTYPGNHTSHTHTTYTTSGRHANAERPTQHQHNSRHQTCDALLNPPPSKTRCT
jgi:hypothetical protein